jgi:peroxin-4
MVSTGGLWHLRIAIPPNYPLAPPTITFTTKISHPNISFDKGEICLTLLTTEHWSPVYTISTTLTAIHQLLTEPATDSPLNVDVAALLRDGDIAGWESIVRYWTTEERWQGSATFGQ